MKQRANIEETKSFFDKKNIRLVLLIVLSSATLTVINYYSLKTTSSVRAYINGESHYSKGQKDASSHLITYLSLEDEESWQAFEEELNVSIGDSLARVGLLNDSSYAYIRAGFLQGRNHKDDVNNLIWLFRKFHKTYFMKDAIAIWKDADVLIGKLKKLGDEAHYRIRVLNPDERRAILIQVNDITTQLSVKERAFSSLLGSNAREIDFILLVVNVCVILLIISAVVLYAYRGYKQLLKTQSDLKQSNHDLMNINQELDDFIYAASHDLKSPINNLEGLIILCQVEEVMKPSGLELIDNIQLSIARLRKTINGLTDVMKTDKSPMDDVEENSFESILNEFRMENNYLLQEAEAEINTDLDVQKIRYSKVGMKSILQNLLTNAVKYRSPQRKCVILIRTFTQAGKIILQVSDNGLGMDLDRNRDRLFKMFNRLHDHVEGTGVGLYMIKRIIERHGGSIVVKSQVNKGTTFSITLN